MLSESTAQKKGIQRQNAGSSWRLKVIMADARNQDIPSSRIVLKFGNSKQVNQESGEEIPKRRQRMQ